VDAVGVTSNAAKQNWNAAHYTQIKVSVKPEIAAKFRAACETSGESMACVLSGFMEEYAAIPAKKKGKHAHIQTTTRRLRRIAMKSLLASLGQIRDAEEAYRDNIPENLTGSSAYEAADECVSLLTEAIDILEAAYQ